MRIASVLILASLCCGCAERVVADRQFGDYLNFQQVCRQEQNFKQEYCDQLWKSYMDAKAKQPAPVTNTMVINDNSSHGYVDPETAAAVSNNQQLLQLDQKSADDAESFNRAEAARMNAADAQLYNLPP